MNNAFISNSRERLSKLLREGDPFITVENASAILGLPRREVAKVLARWNAQGWLARVRRGLYTAVPLEARSVNYPLEEPWTLVPALFDPAYIGGWSAAEHWDLTEQIFRDICVFTQKPVLKQKLDIYSVPFFLNHVLKKNFFGTKIIWIKNTQVLISDLDKTIIDMLSNPSIGGGIVHVIDCFKQYIKRDDWNALRLVEYASRLDNGAVFKRLGFLASSLLGEEHELTRICATHLTQGNARLDPLLPADKLITRWRLFVPKSLINVE